MTQLIRVFDRVSEGPKGIKHEYSVLLFHDDTYYEFSPEFLVKYKLVDFRGVIFRVRRRFFGVDVAARLRAQSLLRLSGLDFRRQFTRNQYRRMQTLEKPGQCRHVIGVKINKTELDVLKDRGLLRFTARITKEQERRDQAFKAVRKIALRYGYSI